MYVCISAPCMIASQTLGTMQHLMYGFCFNNDVCKPGHGESFCPEPQACTICSRSHLTLLLKDQRKGWCCNENGSRDTNDIRSNSQEISSAASSNPSDQAVSPQPLREPQAPVVSNGISTSGAQVLLNVVPVNDHSISAYTFLDSGSTDTLIDSQP